MVVSEKSKIALSLVLRFQQFISIEGLSSDKEFTSSYYWNIFL